MTAAEVRSPLRALMDDGVRPNRLQDVAWLGEYLETGARAGEPILLSLGETWSGTPEPLLAALREVPADSHGYQISMYGLPTLRKALKEYVADTQRLPRGASWELAVSWTGTRSAMRDFATTLERGTSLAVAPAWDYSGVFEPLGFQSAYVPFDPAEQSGPSVEGARAAAAAVPGNLALVVINAQHNPTGANWSPELVEALIEIAIERDAAILVDDAYFGVCQTEPPPTSALAILLTRLAGEPSPVPWLGVRSLGKQFHCNGWALGAVVAEPVRLDDLVNDVRPQHTFNYAIHLQWAMAQWLADRPAVERYLDRERAETAEKRAAVLDWLPVGTRDRVIAGPATPYLLYPVPDDTGSSDVTAYLRRAVLQCGVVLSDAWPLARVGPTASTGYVRMYLGPGLAELRTARDRLADEGLWPSYD
ncbi:pyridoxal phosphate-dependent aminotransferase [Amycolatopsis sp. H20-H5]|uniref:pyridoxal phosphate-dependent aminotransferase n=1 Tax=Amycolatopsis sp. H20-H5 TaxID=3046309 RepID=UPI002DBAE194|nr:pyridoxal phosphate-dependent aminotransferase [Amycolatopsis sp. H20-H5]MEC3978048.1 pyridoxal phosphate-dependent aminotransferase [Amycolatopsis sp. H20-H5]